MLLNCVLEKTLESPLDCKQIRPVHPKGDKSWVFIGRTDAEAETPILRPPDVKTWVIWKDPDVGEDWRLKKETTEDEMVGWHLTRWTWVWVNSRSCWWTGRRSSPWGRRVRQDWATELTWIAPRVQEISETVWAKRDRFQMLHLLTQTSHSIQFQMASWPTGVLSTTRLSFDILSIRPELQNV